METIFVFSVSFICATFSKAKRVANRDRAISIEHTRLIAYCFNNFSAKYRIIFAAILAISMLLPAKDIDDLGPFTLGSLGPSLVFREVPSFEFPMLQSPGTTEMNITFEWLNYWMWNIVSDRPFTSRDDWETFQFKYGTYLLDMEAEYLGLHFHHQASHRLRLGLSLPIINISGGIMDGFIESFHSSFGIDQNRRDWMSNDSALFMFVRPDGTRISYPENKLSGCHLGNISFSSLYALHEGNPSLDVRLVMTAPTSAMEFLPDDGWHTSFQFSTSWGGEHWRIHQGLSVTLYAEDSVSDINYYQYRNNLLTAVELRLSNRTSLILQCMRASAFARYPHLDDPVLETTLGLKKRLHDGVLELGVTENILFFDNSPDFGVHFAYRVILSSAVFEPLSAGLHRCLDLRDESA